MGTGWVYTVGAGRGRRSLYLRVGRGCDDLNEEQNQPSPTATGTPMPQLTRISTLNGALARLPRRFSAFHDAVRRLPTPPSEARRGPSPEGFQAAKGRFPREAGFSAGLSWAGSATRWALYGGIALTAAACSGLTSPPQNLSDTEPPAVGLRAMKLAQVDSADYVFCQSCPVPTTKTLYLVIDAGSDDAAARALARIREALKKRGQPKANLEQIDSGPGRPEEGEPAWVMYAVRGNPRDGQLVEQLTQLVKKHPRSTYRIFGDPDAREAMTHLAKVLTGAGVPAIRMGKNVMQREHVPEEVLGRRDDTRKARSSDADQRLLVIEPRGNR